MFSAQAGKGDYKEEDKDLYLWVNGTIPNGCKLEPKTGILFNGTRDFPNKACDDCHETDVCPNNYRSVFSGNLEDIIPAWTYHPEVGKYYYRAFGHFQPDLNLRNEKVLKELNEILGNSFIELTI